jgi:hypothetical protein
LYDDLPSCSAGYYVLLSIGDICCLSKLGENEDGDLCTTHIRHHVSLPDLSLFEPMELTLELL